MAALSQTLPDRLMEQVMDEAYRRHSFDLFWVNSLWDRGERLIPLLLSRLETARRVDVVKAMFRQGAAIGWLTSLFRSAHGRYGDRPRQEAEWLFTDPELGLIAKLMLDRYQAMSASDVFGCPDPVDLLLAWRQGGDEQGPRRLVEANIASDEGLIHTLEHLTSMKVSRNRGRCVVLKKDHLTPFVDYENVKQRIHNLEWHSDLGGRARILADAFNG